MSVNFFKVRNGVSLGNLASDPSSPVNGDLYYNTATNTFRAYQNGSWIDLNTSSNIDNILTIDGEVVVDDLSGNVLVSG